MTSNTTFTVIVPAAGIGKRMGGVLPKQYLTIAGKTIIEHTLTRLISHHQIGQIIVVLHAQDRHFAQLAIAQSPNITSVIGGEERSDSVLAGLALVAADEQWVLVHDAARPCLHPDDLSALLQLAEQGEVGGILAAPVRDTMKRTTTLQFVEKTESRDNLWHALTPQFFPLKLLYQALSRAQDLKLNITDEASAIEQFGGKVKIVIGRASNIKVTQNEDLLLASFYLTQLPQEVNQT
jgi:2-C-methyl-D-erythritol 4-phosphate cytidylyltransferase